MDMVSRTRVALGLEKKTCRNCKHCPSAPHSSLGCNLMTDPSWEGCYDKDHIPRDWEPLE